MWRTICEGAAAAGFSPLVGHHATGDGRTLNMGFRIDAGLVSVWFPLKKSELPFPFSDGKYEKNVDGKFPSKRENFLEK